MDFPDYSCPDYSLLHHFKREKSIKGFWSQIYEINNRMFQKGFDLAQQKGYGIGVGIVGVSLCMRAIWSPAILLAQIGALKMRLLQPEFNQLQGIMQKAFQAGDKQLLRMAQDEMKLLRVKHGIRLGLNALSITQIPFIIMFY